MPFVIPLIAVCLLIILIVHLKDKEENADSLSPALSQQTVTEKIEEYTGKTKEELTASEAEMIEPALSPDGMSGMNPGGPFRPAVYKNGDVLSCNLYNGGILQVGIEDRNEDGSIYLNPKYCPEGSATEDRYGVYINAAAGTVEYDYAGPYESENTMTEGTAVIKDRTYDTLVPSSGGIRWTMGSTLNTKDIKKEVKLSFRVIRFSDYTVIGTASCCARYFNNEYRLNGLHSTDVADMGLMTGEERTAAVETAIDYIFDKEAGPSFSTADESYREIMLRFATVEKPDRPYFANLLDSEGGYVAAGTISRFNLTAVNVPYIGTGNITVYIAPKLQIEGYTVASTFMDRDEHPEAFGYDFLYPFSKETLYVPELARERYEAYTGSEFIDG